MGEVLGFLRRHQPFTSLEPDALSRVADSIVEKRFKAGDVILQQGGSPATALFVVRKGSVELVADGRVLDLMGEGEVFGHMSLMTGLEPMATVRAHEDTDCLLLDRDIADEVLGTHEGLSYLTASLRGRVERIGHAAPEVGLGRETVGSLLHGPAVICSAEVSVLDAARAMSTARSSCALIARPDGSLGIVTDVDMRDLLSRGDDPTQQVGGVATVPAVTVGPEAITAEALFLMVKGGFHHLPVVDGTGDVLGIVTESDVVGFGADSPSVLRSRIERASTVAMAVGAVSELPKAISALVDARLDPVHIGHVVGATIDALVHRLLDLAFSELGPPPVPWAWLAFGSLGRHEQALHTDQDHGIAYAGTEADEEELDPYFESVAVFVTDALELAGLPRCRGNIMSVSRGLRQSLPGWVAAYRKWIAETNPLGTGVAAIISDGRRVAGPLDVEPVLHAVVRSARSAPRFLQRLAKHGLANTPPTGFFRDFIVESTGEHAGALDLKHRGILPITDLARFLTVQAGVTAGRTLERLRLAVEAGALEDDERVALEEAFRLLWQLRLEHQLSRLRAGESADDYVDPKRLAPVTRQALKESFRTIARTQRGLRTVVAWGAT